MNKSEVNSKELRVVFNTNKKALLVLLSEADQEFIFNFIKDKYVDCIPTLDISNKELIYVKARDEN